MKAICIFIACFAAVAAAAAVTAAVTEKPQATATLVPTAIQPETDSPYLKAKLTVDNGLAQTVTEILIQADDGGPRISLPVTVGPGRKTTRTILLPATAADPTYAIEFFGEPQAGADRDRQRLGNARASISWPADRIDARRFLNPAAVAAFADDPLLWPADLRKMILIAAAAFVLGGAFALLIHRRIWRATLAGAGAVGATAAMVWLLQVAAPPVTRIDTFDILQRPVEGATRMSTVTVVRNRRTQAVQFSLPPTPWRLYADRGQMKADTTRLRPSTAPGPRRTDVFCSVSPGETLIFLSPLPARPGRPRPPRTQMTLDPAGDPWLLEASSATPRAVWLTADRIVAIDAMARKTPRRFDPRRTEPVANLLAEPSRFGFAPRSLNLLQWWLNTGRDIDQAYLLYVDPNPDRPALYVSTVAIP